MLNILRKKGFAKKVIWAVAIVIIISFGFGGTFYLLSGNGQLSYAGKIFGKKVTFEDFNKVYQNTRIQAIRQYGYNLDKVAHLLNLEAQTWDRMILLHEAQKRKIKIPNNKVIGSIRRDQSFARDGRFDILIYNAILRNLRIQARDYEENVRDHLKIAELYKQTTLSVTVAEEGVFEEYKKRNEKIQISYVFVSPESFKEDVSVNAEQIKQYYENNKPEFLMPPTIDVRYMTFNFPEETEQAEDPEAETPIEESQEPSAEEQKDLIREKADNVFQELLINPDMEKVAGPNSLNVQTTGFFSMEQPNLTAGWSYDFLNDLFQMTENEISEPFETPNGVSIVQIKEKRESYIPEFQEAQDKSREAVINVETKKVAREKADGYFEAINEELDKSKLRDFPKTAKELQLEIHQTPVFNRGQYLPKIGISKEFQEAAFELTEDNKISNVVETATGYCILHLDDYIPIENSEYASAKNDLAQEILNEKRNVVFGDFVTQLRVKANLFSNIAELREQSQ